MLDSEVRAKFKIFQLSEEGRKYRDLEIDDVRFKEVSLANDEYFKFIKGKNKYIQRYIKVNEGKYPILGSSLKNGCISAYIKPIDDGDIVHQKCVTFNKDNAKGSIPFFRDYPFLMDRHHIAIIPESKLVDARYLEKALIYFFKIKKFGWGDNVADVSAVKKHSVPIPNDLLKTYTSFEIQEAIVAFLEFWKDSYTDIVRERVSKKKPIYEAIKKIVVENTFKYDKFLVENFNNFTKDKSINLKLEDITFKKEPLHDIAEFPAMTRVSGGIDLKINEYNKLPISEQEQYFALVSGTVENNQIAGYIHKERLAEKSLSNSNIITWTRINSNIFFIQEKPVCTNDDSFVMEVNANNSIEYVKLSIIVAMKKKSFHWGNKAGKTVVKSVSILIPEQLNDYSSQEIQIILVDFWNKIIDQIDKQLIIYKRMSKLTDSIDRAFLYRTFSKIDWSKE